MFVTLSDVLIKIALFRPLQATLNHIKIHKATHLIKTCVFFFTCSAPKQTHANILQSPTSIAIICNLPVQSLSAVQRIIFLCRFIKCLFVLCLDRRYILAAYDVYLMYQFVYFALFHF